MTEHALKVIDAERGIIAGMGIPFGGPIEGKDLEGEFFAADTDLALDWFPDEGRPVLYEHGVTGSLKASVLGRQIKSTVDPEVGVWVEAQLNMAHRYAGAVMKIAGEGALGFSSGAMKHLVVKDDASGKIVRWPWVEMSLTPMPANPYSLIGPDAVKHLDALALDVPEALRKAIEGDGGGGDKGMKYVDHAEHVLADVQAFLTRTESLADLRSQEDRGFSEASYKRLCGLRDELEALLLKTEPQVKGLQRELLRYQVTLARMQGVPLPA